MGWKERLPAFCGGGGPIETIRDVDINGTPSEDYQGNYTTTSKYNLLTFVPKALFEQYRRVANWYFTVVAALSLTAFSPVRPWTTWLPLAFVLGVSMIKEAVEDYKRHKADNEINNRKVRVLNPETKQFEDRRWMDVRVGQVLQVHRDEFIPADLMFMGCDNEDGTCYIETMNLDGETNLKIKKALDATKDLRPGSGDDAGMLAEFRGKIQCEPPNSRLYQFTGNLIAGEGGVEKVPLNPAAILLRGCSLRNTEVVYGAVIYAGHDTKVFMNATKAPSKRSQVEYIVDRILYFMFFLLFSFCIIGAVYTSYFIKDHFVENWYLQPYTTSVQYDPNAWRSSGGTNFITCFILYGYLIPISLYVSIEMVKICQSMVFIAMDLHMYHEESDTPALARTSNLNEDLGVVNTVLSDKTGTLTCNMMEFFKCSIAGVSYGAGVTEIERSNAARHGKQLPENEDPNLAKYRERFFNFYDSRIMDMAWTNSPDAPIIEMFLRMLAVCHTVVPDGPTDEKEIKYEAESPDEAALVVAAKVLGFFFCKRTNTSVTVRERTATGSTDVEYQVLNVLEFDSTRKRMSIIARDSRGIIYLFCKGADTVIYERLDHTNPQNLRLKPITTAHMEEYGSAGLRTLCLACAVLDPAFYEEWQEKFMEAKTSLEDRDAKVTAVSELVERNLVLLGCTAIEDKLQKGVPQCISLLAEAGIRLWVLTGDKMETAINIGYACSLINEQMRQFRISASSFKDVEQLEMDGNMEEADRVANERIEKQLMDMEREINEKGKAQVNAMVIDGKALSYALSDRLAPVFLSVGSKCKSVLCCRVSPLQKAQVTALVKSAGDVTLAIGDGANDVGMIQKAHIGVGISGQEGMQAVMAADFAIAQFRYLGPLLLVHGRWSYKRITRMVNFFFYKNFLFGITLFVFNAFTKFSGQYMYSDVYMTLFNVVFTALTPIIIGIFDRDVDRDMAMHYPAMYKQGQRNTYFNFWSIAGWLLTSGLQCCIVQVLVLLGCPPTVISRQSGEPFGMYEVGVLMYSTIIVTVHLQVALIEEQWTWLHHLSIWGSPLVWWIFLLIFDVLPLSISQDLWHLFVGVTAGSAQYWLYVLLVPVACMLPDFFYRSVKRHLYPADHEILMEEQLKKVRAGRGTSYFERSKKGGSQVQAAAAEPGAASLVAYDAMAAQSSRLSPNTGYVPPYTGHSELYDRVDAQPPNTKQPHHHHHDSQSGAGLAPIPGSPHAPSPPLRHGANGHSSNGIGSGGGGGGGAVGGATAAGGAVAGGAAGEGGEVALAHMSHASSSTRRQLEQQIASMGVRNPVLQHLDQAALAHYNQHVPPHVVASPVGTTTQQPQQQPPPAR